VHGYLRRRLGHYHLAVIVLGILVFTLKHRLALTLAPESADQAWRRLLRSGGLEKPRDTLRFRQTFSMMQSISHHNSGSLLYGVVHDKLLSPAAGLTGPSNSTSTFPALLADTGGQCAINVRTSRDAVRAFGNLCILHVRVSFRKRFIRNWLLRSDKPSRSKSPW